MSLHFVLLFNNNIHILFVFVSISSYCSFLKAGIFIGTCDCTMHIPQYVGHSKITEQAMPNVCVFFWKMVGQKRRKLKYSAINKKNGGNNLRFCKIFFNALILVRTYFVDVFCKVTYCFHLCVNLVQSELTK